MIARTIVRELGAHSFVYSTLRKSDRTPERDSFKFIIGCKEEWCAMYEHRRWYMNDPYVEYARTTNKPILSSKIKCETAGQVEMLETAKKYGFRSGMVIPTHSHENINERMGLLYIGCEEDVSIGEPLLIKNSLSYRALGIVLLDWWVGHLRDGAMKEFKISENEISLLQELRKGRSMLEIAAKMDLKAATIYKRVATIKDKLNVNGTDDAVREASICGLLG